MATDMTGLFSPDQFTKMLEGFRVPGLDVNALMESQRKNVEALTQATQLAAQGATDVSQKQAELIRTALSEAMAMAGSLKIGDATAQQAFVKKAFDTAVANARELAEMVGKSNREAYAVIERRMKEGLEEMRSAAQASTR